MRNPSSFRKIRWSFLIAGGSLLLAFAHACGGKVAVDLGTPAAGGGGSGAGGGPSDACGFAGPANPNGPCKTDGAQCYYADTSCQQTWTCQSGTWGEAQMCFGQTTGGG